MSATEIDRTMDNEKDEKDQAMTTEQEQQPPQDFHAPEYGEHVGLADSNHSQAEASSVHDMERSPEEEDIPSQAKQQQQEQQQASPRGTTVVTGGGAVLEAAFVDTAYNWPPKDGEGRNATELRALIDLLQKGDEDDVSVATTESMLEHIKAPEKTSEQFRQDDAQAMQEEEDDDEEAIKRKWWQCSCRRRPKKNDVSSTGKDTALITMDHYEARKLAAKEARAKERKLRRQELCNRVPEGILIYRLDTSTHELSCLTAPHANTNIDTTLLGTMVVEQAHAATNDSTRRGITVMDNEGKEVTLVACEQRTAIAWLEALQLMLAKKDSKRGLGTVLSQKTKSDWNKERLKAKELEDIEESYLILANYSNKLIRAGAVPGTEKGQGGVGGIYYSVNVDSDGGQVDEDAEEEALEAVAKRRAVIKDSWDFYRMICSLLRDRHKYDEVFRKMQMDPVYPYLNSMTGLNDCGVVSSVGMETDDNGAGYENNDKEVIQPDLPEYSSMTRTQVAQDLVNKANTVTPSLVEICKALAGSLGLEEVGVGPVKEVTAALRKAEKKYNGDILKVTDFCRAMLVVKDFSSWLALLELARDSFGPLIRRVKMSTIKANGKAKAGGYRDCIINVELKEHICEIQVHLWPMWVICGVDGFRHYRHCMEYSTDSFSDAYDALEGLDRKTKAELIVMAEEAVAETPLENLEWYHEKYILDYFAEAGLFMKHDLMIWAEVTFRQLIRLRTESPDIGPQHHETILLNKYLIRTLQAQHKYSEATEIRERIQMYERARSQEEADAEQSTWDSIMCASNDVYDMIMDPNRKDREKEEALRKEVKASKRAWRQIRAERFPFLDADVDVDESTTSPSSSTQDEKKVDDSMVAGPSPTSVTSAL